MTTSNQPRRLVILIGTTPDVPHITTRAELDAMMGVGFSKRSRHNAAGWEEGEIGDVFDEPPKPHLVPAIAPSPAPVRLPLLPTTDPACGPCGARCCKTFPGVPSPTDFGAPNTDAVRLKVRELLATGKWIVDHDGSESRLEHEPSNWYIRPRMLHDRPGPINGNYWMGEGTCVFLVDDRCSNYDARPAGCRDLTPERGGVPAGHSCRSSRAKRYQVDDWEPYESILLEEGYR